MPNDSTHRRALPAAVAMLSVAAAVAGCGQKGPLFLPDEAAEVVTRPTQTPTEGATESTTPPATSPTPETPPEKRKDETSAPPSAPRS